MSGPVVVIGAGQAAAQLAMGLRQGKFAERLAAFEAAKQKQAAKV